MLPKITIRLASACDEDAKGVQNIYGPYVANTAISFEKEIPTVDNLKNRISNVMQKYPWLIAESVGEDGSKSILGYAYACEHKERAAYQWSVDSAVYLGPEVQGQGLGTRMYEALFALLVKQGFFTVIAGATVPNPGSIRLHESLGFYKIAEYRTIGYKLGQWWDTVWYEKQIQPLRENPPSPIPLPQMAKDDISDILAKFNNYCPVVFT